MADTATRKTQFEELKSQCTDIVEKLTKLKDDAIEKNGGRLSEEEQSEFDKLETDYDLKYEDLEQLQSVLAKQGQLANIALPKGRLTGNDSLDLSRNDPDGPFESFGEFLHAVQQCSGLSPDPKLMQMLAPTGSSSGVDRDGGFLVQKQFASELWKRMYDQAVVSGRCRRIGIGANADGLKMNAFDESSRANGSRFGGFRAYWKAEAAQMTSSAPKFRTMEINVQDLTALWYATDRLLQDAVAMQSVASQALPEEFAFVLDDSLINGDGSGKPVGILNAACLVSVAKETGQEAASIYYENVVKMWSRMWARSRANAVWFCNQDIETQLLTMEFPVGTGGLPAFLPPGGASASPYSTLFGRPVVPIEQCATVGTKGDILLADMQQYLLVEKGGIQSDSSIHLRFDYNETAFRWISRINGQPLWNAALTPFKGSNTQSPFISLDTRA